MCVWINPWYHQRYNLSSVSWKLSYSSRGVSPPLQSHGSAAGSVCVGPLPVPVPGPSCVSLLCRTIILFALAHSLLTCPRPEILSQTTRTAAASSALSSDLRRSARDSEYLTLLMFPRTQAEPANILLMVYAGSRAPASTGGEGGTEASRCRRRLSEFKKNGTRPRSDVSSSITVLGQNGPKLHLELSC